MDQQEPSSSELLRRCLAGRREADWRLFRDRHEAMLRRIVGGMLVRRLPGCAGELDDILQDFYFRLLRFSGSYAGRSDGEMWAFLCRTAASVVIDAWRREQRRIRFVLVSAGLLRSTESLFGLGRPPWRARRGAPAALPAAWLERGPEEILLAREAALRRYFALPKRRRRLVWREAPGRPV
jgi:DNA-directed RNA polymerase specialized sigma24 family protein